MYERRHQRLLSRAQFLRRLARHGLWSVALLLLSLAIGTLGFHGLAEQTWVDAFLNAAMLLGGMGPVGEIHTTSGKLFAAMYALYAGLVFLILAGILFAPIFHRTLHRFHLEASGDENR